MKVTHETIFFSRLLSTSSRTPEPHNTTPHLKHVDAFREVLTHYRLHEDAKMLLRATPLVLMTSVSSAGRNTVIDELVKTGRYIFVVSDTTRPRRINNGIWEQNGVEYFFRPEEEVLHDVITGRYIAPALIHGQQVSGINVSQLERANREGKTPITEVEIVGALDVLADKPNTTAIFILPPSFEEWFKRMRRRSQFTKGELHRRLKSAVKEFEGALRRRDIIFAINDRLYDTVNAVDGIIRGAHNPRAEKRARALAQQLYKQTREYLKEQDRTET